MVESTKRMGRKRIKIQKISNQRSRQVTFTKRKGGLLKKAMVSDSSREKN